MSSTTHQSRRTRLDFYIVVVALVAAVWLIQRHMDAVTFGPGAIVSSSSDNSPVQWRQMGLQAVSEMNSLLTTLGTAVLGALGLLLGNRGADRPRPRHLWSAFVSGIAVGISLYFGYVGHLHVLYMIKVEQFDPYSLLYLLPSHSQFYALLVGVFFFADFAVHDLSQEN
jgi:hypothetical protein